MFNYAPGLHLSISFEALLTLYPDLMAGVTLPGDLQRDLLEATIDDLGGGFSMLTTDGDRLSRLITAWSHRNQYKWNTLYKTMHLEYNPIENYRRNETETVDSSQSGTTGENMTGNVKNSSTAFNSTAERETGKSDTGENRSGNYADTGRTVRSVLAYGNIGVTSAQDMMKQEREVAEMDLYSIIARDFIRHFMIAVY